MEVALEDPTAPTEGAQKRPREAGGAVEKAPKQAEIPEEVLAAERLSFYYDKVFPYSEMVAWLSYGGESPESADRLYLSRRELSLTLQGDIYVRYKYFEDEASLRRLLKESPIKIDIGAVYNRQMKEKASMGTSTDFYPEERELVFDIDLTDYDEVRTCCTGASICGKCWRFMVVALRILNDALTNTFGFRHLFYVFSGRRGIHCWVCDASARRLTDEQRTSVGSYLSVQLKGEVSSPLFTDQIHPHLMYFSQLKPFFCKDLWSEAGMDISGHDKTRDRIRTILGAYKLNEDEINKVLETKGSKAISDLIDQTIERGDRAKRSDPRRAYAAAMRHLVLYFSYPRLDIHVSQHRNHLLKSPFCVHPKTGKVCVPIDPTEIDSFDPEAVPSLVDIEHNPDVLGPYLLKFRDRFLDPLRGTAAIP